MCLGMGKGLCFSALFFAPVLGKEIRDFTAHGPIIQVFTAAQTEVSR